MWGKSLEIIANAVCKKTNGDLELLYTYMLYPGEKSAHKMWFFLLALCIFMVYQTLKNHVYFQSGLLKEQSSEKRTYFTIVNNKQMPYHLMFPHIVLNQSLKIVCTKHKFITYRYVQLQYPTVNITSI